MAAASYLFNATIAGIEDADAILIVGRQPAHRGVARQRAHPQALAHGAAADRPDRRARRPHLSLRLSRAPVPRRWPRSSRAAQLRREAPSGAKRPLIIVGPGALARPDGLAMLSAAASLAEAIGAVAEGWNGFCVLHTAASRVGALDLGFVPGEGGLTAAEMAAGRRRRAVQPRRGRDRDRARRLRDLPGHPRRPRRPPRRRDPAGRGLYREDRAPT